MAEKNEIYFMGFFQAYLTVEQRDFVANYLFSQSKIASIRCKDDYFLARDCQQVLGNMTDRNHLVNEKYYSHYTQSLQDLISSYEKANERAKDSYRSKTRDIVDIESRKMQLKSFT